MPDKEEQALVGRACAGDGRAFRSVFDQHQAAVFRFAYRMTGAVEAAEDITQECFLRLISRARFNFTRGSLRQYLYGIARNLARQRWQGLGRELSYDDDADGDAASFAASLPDVSAAEISRVVQAALDLLSPLQREAIVLFELEDLSLEEVAAVVGADAGTVKSRLYRARESLRRILAEYRTPA
jgi:RNA polymerase sigma-70 factor (ECF subfamily)